jgi:PKD repeat protein
VRVLILVALLTAGCAYNAPTAPSVPAPVVVIPPAPTPVDVEPSPILLGLSVSPTPVRRGEATHVSAVVTGGQTPTSPVSYVWTFGDGQVDVTSEGRRNHTYGSVGTFEARVTVTDATGRTGEATTSVSVIQPEPPPPPTPPAPTPPAPSLSVTLTCTAKASGTATPCNVTTSYGGSALSASKITNVDWDWGDGTVTLGSTTPLGSHIYTQAGIYPVEATVTATTSAGPQTGSTGKSLTIP